MCTIKLLFMLTSAVVLKLHCASGTDDLASSMLTDPSDVPHKVKGMGLIPEDPKNWETYHAISQYKKAKFEEENAKGYKEQAWNTLVNLFSYFWGSNDKREEVVLRLSATPAVTSAVAAKGAVALGTSSVSQSATTRLTKVLPSVRNQIFDDCVINAIAAAIEYITTPTKTDTTGLLPLKISRVGLYNATIRSSYYSGLDAWKRNYLSVGSNDQGVTLGDAITTLDRYGAFPEIDLKVTNTFTVPGWGYDYSFKKLPVPQEMFLLALDTDFDGINDDIQNALIDGGYLLKKEACLVPNPYAKVAQSLHYQPIEPPQKHLYDDKFYGTIRRFISEDKPIVIGIGVTSSFKSSSGGLITSSAVDSFLGPHAILVLGYGDYGQGKDCFYIQNSWGSSWGKGGRGYVSKDYFEKYFYGGFALWIPGFF